MKRASKNLVVVVLCAAALLVWVGPAAHAKPEKAQATPTIKLPPIMLKLLLLTNADPERGAAPLKVKFEAEVYEGDEAQIPKFEWDFGDGSRKVREQNPTHTYKKPGTYSATVTVKDATGRSGSDQLDIEVDAE